MDDDLAHSQVSSFLLTSNFLCLTKFFFSTSFGSCGNPLKLQLHSTIYRLRFYWNSLIHISLLSNSHNNAASIQKNRGDKSHRVIVALTTFPAVKWSTESLRRPEHQRMLSYNYTMRFVGYDSIQTRWFISYRFQIRTITQHQYKGIGAINCTV